MSTPVFVDLDISTQSDGAQSSRVHVPLPEDPYEAIRTAHMAVRVSPLMSPSFSVSIAEVAAMPDSAFRKRGRGSCCEGEGLSTGVKSLGLGGDEVVPKGQQRATLVVEIAVGEPLGLGYGALRRQEIASREVEMPNVFEIGQGSRFMPETERPEGVSALKQPTLTTWINPEDGRIYIDVPTYHPPTPPVQTPPSPGWSSGSLLVSLSPSIRYLFKSLKHEPERTAVTFRALWRHVQALEAWAGCVDTWMVDMSRAGYDDHSLVHDMLL
nr:hypothetical protein [Tanacetum cinerariifolium]